MLDHMNNTFRNTVFQISVNVPLSYVCTFTSLLISIFSVSASTRSLRSMLLVITGLLVGWMGGDYKSRKVTVLDFSKKTKKQNKTNLIQRYSRKVSKLAQNQTLIFFSKMALTIFLVFGLKLVLSVTFNLNETYSSGKFAISRYLASKSSQRKPILTFFTIFSTLHHQFSLILHRRACLVVFLQFAGPANILF